MQPKVYFQKTDTRARLPERAHATDAGYDLYSIDHIILKPGERAMVRTGLRMALPEPRHMFIGEYPYQQPSDLGLSELLVGFTFPQEVEVCWEAQIRPRSGNAFKHGLTVINTPGTIDSGYRGDINVLLVNLGQEAVEIRPGDKIAQMVFNLVVHPVIEIAETLMDSDRGEKGFGSSGTVSKLKTRE